MKYLLILISFLLFNCASDHSFIINRQAKVNFEKMFNINPNVGNCEESDDFGAYLICDRMTYAGYPVKYLCRRGNCMLGWWGA